MSKFYDFKKRCEYCEEEYTARRFWQRFCSAACRIGFHRDFIAKLREDYRNREVSK